ncbi:MAG TPA: HAMP domain-containing sensor histidine kinase [Pyrinomonadaceae bacterium]
MKRSRLQIFLVIGLFALLGALAFLQYAWLGQISEAERERVTRRLQIDTERFGEDFNREIQSAYINFQADESLWQRKDWARFAERYDFWRRKTAYPALITDFYYLESKPDGKVLRFDPIKREFVEAEWNDELQKIRTTSEGEKSFEPFDAEHCALVMTIFEAEKSFDRILIRSERMPPGDEKPPVPARLDLPEKRGLLVIKLDAGTIKNEILPDLAKKHFPENDFNLAVVSKDGDRIFGANAVTGADASVKLFDLSPDKLIFFANRDVFPRTPETSPTTVAVDQSKIRTHAVSRVERESIVVRTPPAARTTTAARYEFRLRNNDRPATIIETQSPPTDGFWTLNVQHSAGSLENFINRTRRQNLGVGFGILGLLAVSVGLIFVSAQRARILAQRQVDFVSSVSHEFRTPLAVIYSAGENLADGVAREEKQVSRYGDLIKSEGKKLSRMVEQILEFAGANAGKKKYVFRPQRVGNIIESAVRECQPLIDEKGFTVETEVAGNLPAIKADAAALSQAIQNLVGNSLKYSGEAKRIKISARNGGGRVKIAVEDFGIGIAAKDLKHIFEPFYRAKAVVDAQIHGNGLGLSLVKEAVEAHGGKVSAESEPGKGSRFIIQLPVVSGREKGITDH